MNHAPAASASSVPAAASTAASASAAAPSSSAMSDVTSSTPAATAAASGAQAMQIDGAENGTSSNGVGTSAASAPAPAAAAIDEAAILAVDERLQAVLASSAQNLANIKASVEKCEKINAAHPAISTSLEEIVQRETRPGLFDRMLATMDAQQQQIREYAREIAALSTHIEDISLQNAANTVRQTIEEATQDLSAAPVGVLAALITPRVETVNSDAILAAENADLKQQVNSLMRQCAQEREARSKLEHELHQLKEEMANKMLEDNAKIEVLTQSLETRKQSEEQLRQARLNDARAMMSGAGAATAATYSSPNAAGSRVANGILSRVSNTGAGAGAGAGAGVGFGAGAGAAARVAPGSGGSSTNAKRTGMQQ